MADYYREGLLDEISKRDTGRVPTKDITSKNLSNEQLQDELAGMIQGDEFLKEMALGSVMNMLFGGAVKAGGIGVKALGLTNKPKLKVLKGGKKSAKPFGDDVELGSDDIIIWNKINRNKHRFFDDLPKKHLDRAVTELMRKGQTFRRNNPDKYIYIEDLIKWSDEVKKSFRPDHLKVLPGGNPLSGRFKDQPKSVRDAVQGARDILTRGIDSSMPDINSDIEQSYAQTPDTIGDFLREYQREQMFKEKLERAWDQTPWQ